MAQAFLKQVDLLKDMDKLVRQQIMLVEVANTTSYRWKMANYVEKEKGIFSQQNKSHKSLEGSTRFCQKG